MQYHQQIGIKSFVCGEVVGDHCRKSGKVMDSDRTLWYPCFRVDLAGEKTVHVDLNEPTN